MSVGWECPKCGAVYAPFISQCYRCAPRPLGLTIYPSAPAPGTTGAPMPEPMRVTCDQTITTSHDSQTSTLTAGQVTR